MPGLLLVSASQIVTWREGRGQLARVAQLAAVPWGGATAGTHLVILTARLKQALLDGELQQVVVVVAGRRLPLAAQHTVAAWGLEQRGGDLAATARG